MKLLKWVHLIVHKLYLNKVDFSNVKKREFSSSLPVDKKYLQ